MALEARFHGCMGTAVGLQGGLSNQPGQTRFLLPGRAREDGANQTIPPRSDPWAWPQHGRIVVTARAAMADVKMTGGDLLQGVEEKMDEVIGGQSFAQITRQESRLTR
jgi:hypothetical protein